MSGSLSALFLQNPELANAIRKREQSGALMQQGMDSSPVRHWAQGLSRLAAALVGGYQQGQADREIKGIGERDNAEVGDFLKRAMGGGMAPPQPAIAPPEPAAPAAPPPQGAPMPRPGSPDLMGLVTPIAQKYGVPLNLALGLFQQESGGNPNAVGDGGQSVGLGQIQARTAADPGYGVAPLDPNLRTDPAANVDFAMRYLVGKGRHFGATDLNNPAHQDIALRAYNGGGDPNYVANVRRQMPGDAIPVSAPALPPDAQPVAAPAAAAQGMDPRAMQALALEAANSRNPRLQALAPILMQMASGDNKTVNVAPGGQIVDPRTGRVLHTNTTVSPTVSLTNDMRGPAAFDMERGKTYAARATRWEDAENAALQKMRTIARFRTALDNVETGFGTGASITAGQIADRLGIPAATLEALGMTREQTASKEQIRAMASGMVLESLGGSLGAGFSNADRDFILSMKPGLQNSKEGNLALLKIEEEGAKREREIGRAWRDWRRSNGDSPDSVRRFEDEKLPALVAPEGTAQKIITDSGWKDAQGAGAASGPAEGDTAVNRQTGQRIIFRGGKWEPVQ